MIHIAGVHDGQNLFLYVNGNLIHSLPYTSNIGIVTDDIVINRHRWASGISSRLSGSIDELRISNVARYSSEFTPPNYEFINDDHTLGLFHFNGNIEDDYGFSSLQLFYKIEGSGSFESVSLKFAKNSQRTAY